MNHETTGEGRPRATYLSYEDPRRELEQVDDTLAALVGRYGAAAIEGAALFEAWAELAGEEWGAKATPLSLRDGVLTVAVPTGADAAVARYDEAAIRSRIQARFGPDLVRSIRFRVGEGTR